MTPEEEDLAESTAQLIDAAQKRYANHETSVRIRSEVDQFRAAYREQGYGDYEQGALVTIGVMYGSLLGMAFDEETELVMDDLLLRVVAVVIDR